MTAGLLTLLLSAGPVGAPPASPYHTVSTPGVSTPGRASVTGGEAPAPVVAAPPAVAGYVHEPSFTIDEVPPGEPVGYEPQPGDVVLFVSDNPIWQLLFTIALTGEPYHAAIVVRAPDGTPALLEAGPPNVDPRVRLEPLAGRLAEDSGRVYIRRRQEPLTTEQCDALTCFAVKQKGKPYALFRFFCQGTPLRCRGPLRTKYLGKCRGECFSYFCSELVMESLVAACLCDKETTRPRATTPQDLFYDESDNPYIDEHLKLCPKWGPPQRWICEKCCR
jgi:hypothetical protein